MQRRASPQTQALGQRFAIELKNHNPLIPDWQLQKWLGLPTGDIRLLARIRAGTVAFPVKHLGEAMRLARALHGKLTYRPRGKPEQVFCGQWEGMGALQQEELLALRSEAQHRVQELAAAVGALREALLNVREQMRRLAEEEPEVRLFTRMPHRHPPEDLLEIERCTLPLPDHTVRTAFDVSDLRITGAPLVAWVDSQWVRLDQGWTADMIETPVSVLAAQHDTLAKQRLMHGQRIQRMRALISTYPGEQRPNEWADAEEEEVYEAVTPDTLHDPNPSVDDDPRDTGAD